MQKLMILAVIGIVGGAGVAAAQAPRSAEVAAAHANAVAETAHSGYGARALPAAAETMTAKPAVSIASAAAGGMTHAATMAPRPSGAVTTGEAYDNSILDGSSETASALYAGPSGNSISTAAPDLSAPRMATPSMEANPPSMADTVSPNADKGTTLVLPAAAAESASASPAGSLSANEALREPEGGAVRSAMAAAVPAGALAAVASASVSSALPASAAQAQAPRQMLVPPRFNGRKARK
jgi:hypothetical protein